MRTTLVDTTRSSLQHLIRRNWRTTVAVLAIAGDLSVIILSYLLACALAFPKSSAWEAASGNITLLILLCIVFIGFFTTSGLYRTLSYSSFKRQVFTVARRCLYSAVIVMSVWFFFHENFAPRSLVLLFLILFPPAYLLFWWLVRLWLRSLHEKGFGRWNTLAVGMEPHVNSLLRRLDEYPDLGYDVQAVVVAPDGHDDHGILHVRRADVQKIVEEKNVNLIAFSSSRLDGSFEQLEELCRQRRITMRVISPESDVLFSRARLNDIAGISLFVPERKRLDFAKQVAKRIFDILGSALCLALFSPLFGIVAIATKLESKGPVFFKQLRTLTDADTPFEFYKFRSMIDEADGQRNELTHRNESSGALFKIKDDPRLTKVGRIIRRYSIDELPQLVNVLKGDMSLVGPRPLPYLDFNQMRGDDHMGGYYRQRARAKPGMTGLWQISGRSDLGFREMVLLDLYYVENQTLLFDIEILAQTIPVVLFGRGAY